MAQANNRSLFMKKIVIAGLLAAAATGAMADGAFDGVNAQLGLGFASLGANTSTSYSDTDGGNYSSSSSENVAQNGLLGNVALGYSYGLNKQFNLAANIFYNFGSSAAGNANSSASNTNYTENSNFNPTLKNIWGISVEPGYYFADKSLGFVKLGWAMASAKASWNYSENDAGTVNNSSGNVGFGTSNGFLYGLGFKQLLTENIYLGVEAYQVDFSSKTSSITGTSGTTSINAKPKFTYGGINIGYKF